MSISAKNRYYLKRILPFGVIWLLLGWLLMWTEYAAMTDQTKIASSAIPITSEIIVFSSISVFIVGCLVGVIEVFYVSHLFVNQSLPKKLIGKFSLYAFVLAILVFILYMIAASIISKEPVYSASVWEQYVDFFFSITHISTWIQLLFSLLVSLFYFEISENLGQNVFINFFTAKYHKPVVEERIFMFVDMKDSTSIAEKIGHQNYFKLLRSYYRSFSDAIIKNRGEVYQYVGDEIVVTWSLDKGLENNHCIKCFFDMKAALLKKQHYFQQNFETVLDFKAALHFGKVTTGEIGALKKDIFFTGDVLNTTARILSLTASYGEDVLISGALSRKLNHTQNYSFKKLGSPSLKGKADSVEIIALNQL